MATEDFESAIDIAAEHARKTLREVSELVAPKPMGAVKVKTEDMRFDYENQGPDYWPKFVGKTLMDAQTTGGTLYDALKAAIELDREMRNAS